MNRVTVYLALTGLIIASPSGASATIIHVPGDSSTIQSGINGASAGDTVLVEPGIYHVNLDFSGKSIVVTSEAGPLLTILKPLSTSLPVVTFANGEPPTATLAGFTLRNAEQCAVIRVDSSSPTIAGNQFTDHHANSLADRSMIYVYGSSHCIIKQNLFWNNPDAYAAVWGESDSLMYIINNTIHNGRKGLVLKSPYSVVENNTVTGCIWGMHVTEEMTRQYNNIWGNGTDWTFGAPDPTDLSADPLFIDTANGNYHLVGSSPLIDAGDPDPQYNDLDGTRNDIGAFPFDQRVPAATNLNLGTEDVARVMNHTPTFYWMFYDTVGSQAEYEMEVGTDVDWSVAEMWTSGQVSSSDTFSVYSGAVLQDGVTYYYRIRVNNGTVWGIWNESVFRMYELPSIPLPVWPTNQALVSVYGVQLLVANSTSPFGDDVTYDFELYDDAGLTNLVDSRYDVEEQENETYSGLFSGLSLGAEYWWQCRAHDGLDYSDWSQTESFITRNPIVICVPSEQPTIQAGLDGTSELDTVLVADGTYTGSGNRDLDFHGTNVVLMSENGPEFTTIDCEASLMDPHRAFYLHSGEDTTAVIQGFTITGAYSDDDGAISLNVSSVTLRNCMISENLCGGIYSYTGGYDPPQRLNMSNCVITNNGAFGIWIYIAYGVIANSEISYNNGHGVDLAVPKDIQLSNLFIQSNSGDGIAVEAGYPADFTISENTVVGNHRGLYHYYWPPKDRLEPSQSGEIVSNNIFAYNLDAGVQIDGLPVLLPTCNNSFGNPGGDWVHFPGDTLGNISLDPLFCDTGAGDFTIAGSSPCAPANNSCGVLMGAFDIGCDCCEIRGDIDRQGGINIVDLTYLVAYLLGGGPAPPCEEEADVNADAAVNIVDLTYIVAYLFSAGPPPEPCP